MNAAIDSTTGASPLSPEQRALLACWGGEGQLQRAAHALRIGIDRKVTPQRLRAAVLDALRAHAILRAGIGGEAGGRGLRIRFPAAGVAPEPLALPVVSNIDDFLRLPLNPQNGENLRFAVAEDEGGERCLLVSASPLVADRGSLAVLAEHIQRACAGEAPAALAFDYPQYLEWRCALDDGDEAVAGKAYWRRYLQDTADCAPPRLACRGGETRNDTSQWRRVAGAIDAPSMARVIDIAAKLAVTPELLLQALWWALLARLTGCNRYAAGWQHDCRRDYTVMRGAVGAFEKVLPLVIEGGGDEPLSGWIRRLADNAEAHLEAQEFCPIDEAPMAPYLAVGFAAADAPTHSAAVELPGPMPCFELALVADFAADTAELALYADAALYSQRALETLLAQYRLLLQGALEQPDCRLADIALMDEAGWRAQQAALCGPRLDVGAVAIAGKVAHWAAATPAAPAVVCGGQTLSYAELDARANRLAHWLRGQGVAAGELVALALPRSPALIVAMLAAWRIGAGYLPLEPEWPLERRNAVLRDAKPALLLVASEAGNDVPCSAAALGDIALETFAASPPAYAANPDDPAYVLYTSGSTGRPKGVRIGQRQLLNYVVAASAAMELDACRRWGLVSSVAADLGNTALFGALFHGACLAIAEADEARDGRAFARFMARHRIDALKIVPSHLDVLLEGAAPEGAAPAGAEAPLLPRTLVLGGEAATRALIERIKTLAAGCIVHNHYGPTETTVGVMVHRVAAGAVPAVLPLSRVLANNHVYVLDETQQPVPVGALGELYVGGAQVSAGYLNRENGGAFIDDPWQRGQRLYRTGDLAWVLPEGGLRLAGRADHQVKINGFRVEPAEVEAALMALPGVRQAAVFSHAAPAGATLAAFIVGGAELLPDGAWRVLLAQRLPAHMVPAALTALDDFPRLANGKIDRLALAAQPAAIAAPVAGAVPHGALERLLSETMAVLLGRDHVPADADFFELGGHSLLVIRLVARIRRALQLEIEPGLVFDHPTAQNLAAALRAIDDPARLDRLAQQHPAPARPAV